MPLKKPENRQHIAAVEMYNDLINEFDLEDTWGKGAKSLNPITPQKGNKKFFYFIRTITDLFNLNLDSFLRSLNKELAKPSLITKENLAKIRQDIIDAPTIQTRTLPIYRGILTWLYHLAKNTPWAESIQEILKDEIKETKKLLAKKRVNTKKLKSFEESENSDSNKRKRKKGAQKKKSRVKKAKKAESSSEESESVEESNFEEELSEIEAQESESEKDISKGETPVESEGEEDIRDKEESSKESDVEEEIMENGFETSASVTPTSLNDEQEPGFHFSSSSVQTFFYKKEPPKYPYNHAEAEKAMLARDESFELEEGFFLQGFEQ